jgi:uncharacterized protein YabE (DUF348 family)
MNVAARLIVIAAIDTTSAPVMTGAARIASFLPPADPFAIDHDCINPAGHSLITDCTEIVCRHCARIFG